MKNLKKNLQAVHKELRALDKKVDKIVVAVGKLEKPKVVKKEKRKHPRFACLIEANFIVQERAYKGFIKNVSSGGAYIETREPFSVGQKIELAFPSPNREGILKWQVQLYGSVQTA